MNQNRSLLSGSVALSMLRFSLPMFLGNMMQQLYNIVDTWIVGHFIGTDALAAVGSVFTLMVFITSILLGLCMGSGVIFSLDYGKDDIDSLQRRVPTAFLMITCVMIMIMTILVNVKNPMLQWMNIPKNILGITQIYLNWIILGIPAIFLYNFFASYLKSIGNSVLPLVWLFVSTIINIILDIAFVLSWENKIAGVAIATVLSQYISAFGCVVSTLISRTEIKSAFKKINILTEDILLLIKYSFYTCLQQSIMNLGILVVQGTVNHYGQAVMAAFATGVKIDAFAYMPAQEWGNAFSTFIAQNRGAKQDERIRSGIKYGFLISICYCMIISLVLWIFAKQLMTIFIDANEIEMILIGVRYLHIEGAFYVGIGCLFLLYGLYRAIGMPQMSLILTIISLGTRVILAQLTYHFGGSEIGIWWAIPIGWALADAFGILYFLFRNDIIVSVK